MRNFTLLLIVLNVSSCIDYSGDRDGKTTENDIMTNNIPIEYVVFDAKKKAFAYLFSAEPKYWTPDTSDVSEAEAQIRQYLQKEHPSLYKSYRQYKVQFTGLVLPEAAKTVYANYFCEDFSGWKSSEVDVDDGGDCYFQVRYDVDKKRCFKFSINGGA